MQAFLSRYVPCPAGAALALSLALALPLGAQEAPQDILVETKLLADDGVDGDNFGAAIAVEGDVLVVAAPGADLDDADEVDSSGVVYVFLRNQATGEWMQHQKLVPERGHYEGNFLAMTLAIQGDTLVAGAPYATFDRFQEGVVYVFGRDDAGNWTETARITDDSVGSNGHFGTSLALEGDLLVVGATQESIDRRGRVGIFERDRGGPGNWGRVATLYGFNWTDPSHSPDDAGNPRAFGSSVAIDGDLLLVGARTTTITPGNPDGATYFFRRDTTDRDRWHYLTRLVRPGADDCVGGLPLSKFYLEATPEEIEAAAACARDNPFRASNFGHQVAIRGNIAVVSAQSAAGEDGSYSVGEVHVYERDPSDSDVWLHVERLAASDPSSPAYFGSDLVLAGSTLVVAARGTTNDSRQYQGAVYIFERDIASDSWEEIEKLIASDGLSFSYFGEAVALDGQPRLIGAKGDNAARGAVYLHEPELPEEPAEPAFEPSAELVNDGLVEHSTGVLLGAAATTLATPLPVWIHQVGAPTEPLASGVTPLGPYYNIGAIQTTPARGQPFGLALPVPDGADTQHLALAILLPPHRLPHPADASGLWMPVRGVYDAEQRLFSVVLGALFREGRTLVLVEDASLTTLPEPAPAGLARSGQGGWTFMVDCAGWPDPASCGPEQYEKIQSMLQSARQEYIDLGYPEPALNSGLMQVRQPNPDRPRKMVYTELPIYYNIGVRSKNDDPKCAESRGSYAPGDRSMYFCYAGDQSDDILIKTVRHELYHAVQHSPEGKLHQHWAGISFDTDGQGVYKDLAAIEDYQWISEGIAEAAEDSRPMMTRSHQHTLHPINRALTASDRINLNDRWYVEYQAQDFWVWFGSKKELGLGYLKGLFDRGGDPAAADRFFAEEHQTSLGTEYWAWVKNQAIEKTIDFDKRLQQPCTLETPVVGPMKTLLYPQVDANAAVEGQLPRLTSEVIRIIVTQDVGSTIVNATADGRTPEVDYNFKVYREDEQGCVDVPDLARTFDALPAASVLYVIVSNLRHQPANDRLGYRVSVAEAATEPSQ